jgi:hypothetical protein
MEGTEVKTISPSILGRNRKKYETMRQLDGVGDKEVKSAMKLDLKVYNKEKGTEFTLDEYVAMLEALNKPKGAGKRDADKVTRDALITETQDLLGVVNLAVSHKRGQVTLTSKEKVKAFDALAQFGTVLSDHLKTSFSPIGGMTMVWNPQSQVPTAGDGLAVYIGGWEDGSNKPRYQYAPRKCPISKRSGYRDDSFDVAVHELKVKAEGKEPEVPVEEGNTQEPTEQ